MKASEDSFSSCAPLVTFFFFIGAILFGMVFVHPAYSLIALISAMIYYLTICGKKGIKSLAAFFPLFVFLSALNPLLNTRGEHVLFMLAGRPYTLEALLYGMITAGMFITVMIWFMCYNRVMTSEKFTTLFGNIIPSLSLLLVMVLRLVPSFLRQTDRISAARRCVGLGSETGGKKQRMLNTMLIVSALTSWALEGSISTADSMRARGYGSAGRTSFYGNNLTKRDHILLLFMVPTFLMTAAAAFSGAASAEYTPVLSVAPIKNLSSVISLFCYAGFLLTPALLNLYESLLFRQLRKKVEK